MIDEHSSRLENHENSGVKALHPRCEARNFARSGIFVDNAFRYAAHDLGLGSLERSRSRRLVAGTQGLFHLAHRRADQALAVLVDSSAAGRLADALFGRRMAGHGLTLARFEA